MTWDLPPGWRWTPLPELLTTVRTYVRPDAIDGAWLYLGLEHVEPGTGEYTGVRAGDADIRSAKLAFDPGDVLFGKLRPNLRKCVVARTRGVASTDLVPLRPVDPDAAHFLALQLRSEPVTAEVLRLVGGANLPRVPMRDVATLSLPTPPPAEAPRLHALARSAALLRHRQRELAATVGGLERVATEAALGLGPGPGPAS